MYELLHTLLHLCAFAQLGTLVRIYLGKVYGGACSPWDGARWAWVPCVTNPEGALFTDLPANALGSFIMGLLSTSGTLAAVMPAAQHTHGHAHGAAMMAALPPNHPLQHHAVLHLALRTGFCGSLTTFSSWMLQVVVMMIGGIPSQQATHWVEGLSALFIGTTVSLASLSMGQHAAALLQARYTVDGGDAKPALAATAAPAALAPAAPAAQQQQQGSPQQQQPKPAQVTPSGTLTRGSAAFAEVDDNLEAGCDVELELQAAGSETIDPPLHLPHKHTSACFIADSCAALLLVGLTAVSIALAITDKEDASASGRRYFWIAICLGPVGCLLRWQLGKLNGRAPQRPWLPVGTLSANLLACTLNFAMQAIMMRVPGMDSVNAAVLTGIITGISGCLSTVSTWVVEVQKLCIDIPDNLHGYIYMLGSIVSSVVLGIIIYGTAVWTA